MGSDYLHVHEIVWKQTWKNYCGHFCNVVLLIGFTFRNIFSNQELCKFKISQILVDVSNQYTDQKEEDKKINNSPWYYT